MRLKVLSSALTTLLVTGALVVATALPAAAVEYSGVFEDVVCTTNPNFGTQLQDIPYNFDVPTEVNAGESFSMTFNGGDADLPALVLGFVQVQSYANLQTAFQVEGGTFDQPSLVVSGPTLTNGNPTADEVTFPAADTIKFGTLTAQPGTLTTPDRTIDVIAPNTPGAQLKVFANTLTTTVFLGGTPPGQPVAATCPVPHDVIATINVVEGGPQTTVDAGGDVTGDVNTAIQLDGSFTDPFGTPTLTWTTDSPSCTFSDAHIEDPTITCTSVGTFSATLTADDGPGHPTPHDSTQVVVTTPNVPPTVNAGPNVSGEVNDDIALDGSVTDPDNTPSVLWTIDSPNCTFSDDTDPETTVNCTSTGTFAATLTANDGINVAVSDTALVQVNPPPPGLNVSAGPDVAGGTNTPIFLNGKVTDPGFAPTMQWTSDSPNCSFGTPNAEDTTISCTTGGVFAATLTATDGFHTPASDTAIVAVNAPNAPPSVDAGPDVSGVKNTAIALDGTVTDPDSSPSVTWATTTPGCSFGNIHMVDTTITCTNTGIVAATLTADDVVNDPVSDTAIVTVVGNAPPSANAGPDVATVINLGMPLDGTVTDSDDTPTAHWSTGSPNCSFTDENAVDTSITCTVAGVYAATLTANDGVNTPVSDTALVTVGGLSTTPTVDAGGDKSAVARHQISLDGVVTDPDTPSPSIHWSTANPACTFGNANVAATTVTCDNPGVYAVTLTADDGANPPVSDTALVTFTPPACVGLCVSIGDVTTYEGGAAALTLTMSQPQPVAVTVTVKVLPVPGGAINGTGLPAAAPRDFKTPLIRNIKIPINKVGAFVGVTALKDGLVEGDESFVVEIQSASGVPGLQLGRTVGTYTIKDLNSQPDGIYLTGNASVVEPDACATCKLTTKVTVVLSGPNLVTSVRYTTVNAGAVSPGDYTHKTALVKFAATGAIQKSITMVVIGDNGAEATEGINLNWSQNSGVPLPAPGHIDILDND